MDTAKRVSEGILEDIFAQGGGLIAKRTVHQWLWDAPDPLLKLIQPWNPNAHLNDNYTSPEDAQARSGPTVVWTGKSDPSLVFWYITWNGTSEITAYPIKYNVSGTTEDGQFAPFLTNYQSLSTWNNDYERAILLVPKEEVDVLGLHTHRYMIDNSTFSILPDYYQYLQGFINLTSLRKAPVFLSNPHWAGAEDYWRDRIIGMKPVDFNTDYTTADIEPYLGKVVQAYKNLQVNVLIPEGTDKFIGYNPGIRTGIMFPILWAYEQETINDALANEIKDRLYAIIVFQSVVLPIFIPVGVVLSIIGFIATFVFGICNYRLRKIPLPSKVGYEIINND